LQKNIYFAKRFLLDHGGGHEDMSYWFQWVCKLMFSWAKQAPAI